MVKLLSAVKNGHPGSSDPLAALKAYSFIPNDGATTAVTPFRFPTAIDACTPWFPWGSGAFCCHSGPPPLLKAK